MLHEWRSYSKQCPDCFDAYSRAQAEMYTAHVEKTIQQTREQMLIMATDEIEVLRNKLKLADERLERAEVVIKFYADREHWRNHKGFPLRGEGKAMGIARADAEPWGIGMIGGRLAREYMRDKDTESTGQAGQTERTSVRERRSKQA